jgi:hypothetical protein
MIYLQEINALRIVEELLINFAEAVPRFLGAILILLLGWLISRLISRLLRSFLQKVGVDKLADRIHSIELIHNSKVRIVPSVWITKVVYYFLIFITVAAATDVLDMPAISLLMNDFLNYLPYLISALAVLVVGIVLADFVRNLVLGTCRSLGIPAANFIAGFVFYFLVINVVMITLDQAEIQTEFIQDNLSILFGGIVFAFALGYGLASRPFVASLLAGFYFRHRINPGDLVRIKDVKGEVIAKDARTITLKTESGEVVFPLNRLTSEPYEIHHAEP